jgi:hypothetical protein
VIEKMAEKVCCTEGEALSRQAKMVGREESSGEREPTKVVLRNLENTTITL